MEKQKELDRLTKELVKQMTGKEVEDTQEADYQISYYYLNKAMDYTRCCTELIAKEYAEQKCKEQREICADNARVVDWENDQRIDIDKIRNAPLATEG